MFNTSFPNAWNHRMINILIWDSQGPWKSCCWELTAPAKFWEENKYLSKFLALEGKCLELWLLGYTRMQQPERDFLGGEDVIESFGVLQVLRCPCPWHGLGMR